MNDAIVSCMKTVVQKLNLYKVLQVLWLIEFYFLAVFSGKQAFEKVFKVSMNEPQLISKYSIKMFDWLSEYNSYIFCLALILLVVGLSGGCVAKLPVLRDYKLIHLYADIGWYSGGWLILISLTYWAYTQLDAWFVFAPMIVYIVCKVLKKVFDSLLGKIGLSPN